MQYTMLWLLFVAGFLHEERINAERVPLTQFMNGRNWNERWKFSGYEWDSTTTKLAACGTRSTQPNSWTWSDNINTTPALGIELIITYTARDCTTFSGGSFCKHEFDVYAHQSQTKYPEDSIPNPSPSGASYRNVGRFSAQKLWSTKPVPSHKINIDTLTFVLEKTKPYLYLALHYRGGCFAISDLKVNYFRCENKALTKTLVQLPETVAPANGSVLVNGSCTQNSLPVGGVGSLHGYCQSNGEWNTVHFSGECQCEAGYQNTTTALAGAECQVCTNGTYKYTAASKDCNHCPRNSLTEPDGRSCGCASGFYRASSESISAGCTSIPSAPRSLKASFVNATQCALSWSIPEDEGGRSDLYYRVECKKCDANGSACYDECGILGKIAILSTILQSLRPYTYYNFKVYARNGVSEKAESSNQLSKFVELLVRTNESVPGQVVITRVSRVNIGIASVEWTLKEKNGIILFYQVEYYPADQSDDRKIITTNATRVEIGGLKANVPYIFQVLAKTRPGYGPTSKAVTLPPLDVGDRGSTEDLKIGMAVLGAILFLVLLVAGIYFGIRFRSRKRRTERKDVHEYDEFTLHPSTTGADTQLGIMNDASTPDAIYAFIDEGDNVWEVARQNLSIIKRLGSGNFGHVDKAVAIGIKGFPGQIPVAVKTLKANAGEKDKTDFLTELRLMKFLEPHTRVVRLLGCCTQQPGDLAIILEYLPYGDLLGYLRRSRGHEDMFCTGDLRPSSRLTSQDLLKFAWMIADGMAFLAKNKCVHRDLAARNVLVGENNICKISDLGLARAITNDMYTRHSEARLPVKWMPPESLLLGQSTIASDVWSYGIVLWEIFTIGDSPYPGILGKDMPCLLRDGYRMSKPLHLSDTLYDVMLKCWQNEPEDRPTFESLCEEMNEFYKATKDYINLDVYDDSLYVNFDVM